jgi:hypothetical protein
MIRVTVVESFWKRGAHTASYMMDASSTFEKNAAGRVGVTREEV